jgi:hypothetical protein
MNYTLTIEELKALDFIGARYTWVEIVLNNLNDNVLSLDNMAQHEMNETIDTEGLPLLNPDTGLYDFLIYLEPV